MTTKISYKDVVNFFDGISQDMAELVLGIIEDNLEKRAARRMKMSANLKKARAAKGKGGSNSDDQRSQRVKADPQVQAEIASDTPVHRGPGKPRRVEEYQHQQVQAQTAGE